MRWLTAVVVTAGLLAVMIGGSVAADSSLPGYAVVVGSAVWAASTASSLELRKYGGGMGGPAFFFFGVLLLWVFVFPAFPVVRSRRLAGELRLREKHRPAPPTDPLAASLPRLPGAS